MTVDIRDLTSIKLTWQKIKAEATLTEGEYSADCRGIIKLLTKCGGQIKLRGKEIICHLPKCCDRFRNKSSFVTVVLHNGKEKNPFLASAAEPRSLHHPSVGWNCQKLGEPRERAWKWVLKVKKSQHLAESYWVTSISLKETSIICRFYDNWMGFRDTLCPFNSKISS